MEGITSAHEGGGAVVDPRSRAEQAARALSGARSRAALTAAVAALGLIVVLCLLSLPVLAAPLLLIWPILVLPVAGWAVRSLIPRQREPVLYGYRIDPAREPVLVGWVNDLSTRLGVESPEVRVAPRTRVWLSGVDGEVPAIVIGTGALAWMTQDELARMVAWALSPLRLRSDDQVLRAYRLSVALDARALTSDRTHLLGAPLRRIGRALHAHQIDLADAVLEWSTVSIPPQLRMTAAVIGEAGAADEGWQLMADQWIAPVTDLGLGVDSVALAFRDLMIAADEHDLHEREWTRDQGAPALGLVREMTRLDRDTSAWAAQQPPVVSADLVGWENYIALVSIPSWQQSVAAAVGAISHVKQTPQPVTVDTVLSSLRGEWAPMVDAWLTKPGPHRGTPEPLIDALVAAVRLNLIASRRWTPQLDILWGVVLIDSGGEPLDVDPIVRKAYRGRDLPSLRRALDEWGVDVNLPLWQAHDPTPADAPIAERSAAGVLPRE